MKCYKQSQQNTNYKTNVIYKNGDKSFEVNVDEITDKQDIAEIIRITNLWAKRQRHIWGSPVSVGKIVILVDGRFCLEWSISGTMEMFDVVKFPCWERYLIDNRQFYWKRYGDGI